MNSYDRILLLGSLDIAYIAAIEQHITLVQRATAAYGGYAHMYNALRFFIRNSVRRCWTRRAQYPTLYSLRHQFSSNLKIAGYSRGEIAALMGHGSDATAGFHYGKN